MGGLSWEQYEIERLRRQVPRLEAQHMDEQTARKVAEALLADLGARSIIGDSMPADDRESLLEDWTRTTLAIANRRKEPAEVVHACGHCGASFATAAELSTHLYTQH